MQQYGLDDLPDGRRSALRTLVSNRLRASKTTIKKAAEVTGLSRNTIVRLGTTATDPRTLKKLELLGIPEAELDRAWRTDKQRATGVEFPSDVYDLAVAAMPLAPVDRKMLTAFADVIHKHRPAAE